MCLKNQAYISARAAKGYNCFLPLEKSLKIFFFGHIFGVALNAVHATL